MQCSWLLQFASKSITVDFWSPLSKHAIWWTADLRISFSFSGTSNAASVAQVHNLTAVVFDHTSLLSRCAANGLLALIEKLPDVSMIL